MAEEDITVDQEGSGESTPPNTTPPSPSEDGQRKETIQDDLPEKFKGKSASEIAKSYIELEKKFADHGKEVGQTRQELENWKALGRVIEDNPELAKQIDEEIDRIAGKKSESNKTDQTPKSDDTRTATENIIIGNFEKQYGLDRLDGEKKMKINQAIGEELADMIDPGGKMSVKQVLDSIPLDRLDKYLHKAYRLATINDRDEQARVEALVEARNNSEASFGSIPSSGLKSNETKLSPDEIKVARKMGISEEDYLKNKLALDK